MTSVDWSAVKADDFAVPHGHDMAGLTAELTEMLRSPDPQIRDTLGFGTLARWISRGHLSDDQQVALGDQMAQRFTDPEVQARTFAPLILACLAERDVADERWVAAFERWYAAETDLRGYDPTLGWLHAVAHGGDLLGELGLTSTVDPRRMLGLAARRLAAPTDLVWREAEDDRLGYALAQTLTREDLGPAEATAWLDAVEALLAKQQGVTVAANASNSVRTLRMLHVLLETGVRVRGRDLPVVPPHAQVLKVRLVEVLHLATPWMW